MRCEQARKWFFFQHNNNHHLQNRNHLNSFQVQSILSNRHSNETEEEQNASTANAATRKRFHVDKKRQKRMNKKKSSERKLEQKMCHSLNWFVSQQREAHVFATSAYERNRRRENKTQDLAHTHTHTHSQVHVNLGYIYCKLHVKWKRNEIE